MNKKLKSKIVLNFETQADFARVIKCDETIISRIIRGRRSLPVETQKKWADCLNCKPEDIFPDGD